MIHLSIQFRLTIVRCSNKLSFFWYLIESTPLHMLSKNLKLQQIFDCYVGIIYFLGYNIYLHTISTSQ